MFILEIRKLSFFSGFQHINRYYFIDPENAVKYANTHFREKVNSSVKLSNNNKLRWLSVEHPNGEDYYMKKTGNLGTVLYEIKEIITED